VAPVGAGLLFVQAGALVKGVSQNGGDVAAWRTLRGRRLKRFGAVVSRRRLALVKCATADRVGSTQRKAPKLLPDMVRAGQKDMT
jgi:hypothetical protein